MILTVPISQRFPRAKSMNPLRDVKLQAPPMHFRTILAAFVSSIALFAAVPLFEAASVKPCRVDVPPDARTGGGISSPALLAIECQTVRGLIQGAYGIFAVAPISPR